VGISDRGCNLGQAFSSKAAHLLCLKPFISSRFFSREPYPRPSAQNPLNSGSVQTYPHLPASQSITTTTTTTTTKMNQYHPQPRSRLSVLTSPTFSQDISRAMKDSPSTRNDYYVDARSTANEQPPPPPPSPVGFPSSEKWERKEYSHSQLR